MKRFWNWFKNFLKAFIPLWIIVGVVGCFCIVDGINYAGYKINVLKTYTDENPEGDPKKLYFSDPEGKDEVIKYDLQILWYGNPKSNHTIVGIGKKNGSINTPRAITNNNGVCTFELSVYPVYKTQINEINVEILFYEESSGWIIEFQVKTTIQTTLYRRPKA